MEVEAERMFHLRAWCLSRKAERWKCAWMVYLGQIYASPSADVRVASGSKTTCDILNLKRNIKPVFPLFFEHGHSATYAISSTAQTFLHEGSV